MNNKPGLLIYCQHSLGMGHLIRSFALARGLAESFAVTFLNGGGLPEGINIPETVEMINLPALGTHGPRGELVSRDQRYSVEQAKEIRLRMIHETFHRIRPKVLFIELFPLGRKKFAWEVEPLLEAGKGSLPEPPLIICSVRDILVNRGGERQQIHDDRAKRLLEKYFDAVLIHSDPSFARLEESFKPAEPLKIPTYYTGFALFMEDAPTPRHTNREILVSAGGGLVGGRLFRAALDAQEKLWSEDGLSMAIVTGPFFPEEEWQTLKATVAGRSGLRILRSVPNLFNLIQDSAASVSQCGYNTALDLLRAGVPSLVVPYQEDGESEQLDRANRLEKLGVLRILKEENLNGPNLARQIQKIVQSGFEKSSLDLNGSENTRHIVEKLALEIFPNPSTSFPITN
ncbi:MAG: glycosyltransferase family protein [Nitrospinaceae bacterium]